MYPAFSSYLPWIGKGKYVFGIMGERKPSPEAGVSKATVGFFYFNMKQ